MSEAKRVTPPEPSKLMEMAREWLNVGPCKHPSILYGSAHPRVESHAEFGERVARKCAEIAITANDPVVAKLQILRTFGLTEKGKV